MLDATLRIKTFVAIGAALLIGWVGFSVGESWDKPRSHCHQETRTLVSGQTFVKWQNGQVEWLDDNSVYLTTPALRAQATILGHVEPIVTRDTVCEFRGDLWKLLS